MDLKTLFTIGHLFGVALGAGGAYMSDMMFFSSIKDDVISRTEMRFLRLGSAAVWGGLLLLLVTGLGIFLLDPAYYMASGKFLSKMTIVAIIIINGIFFHRYHMPRMERHAGRRFSSSREFITKAPLLMISGAVSFVSWTSAVVLGSMRQVSLSYFEIMGIYALCLGVAVITAYLARGRVIHGV